MVSTCSCEPLELVMLEFSSVVWFCVGIGVVKTPKGGMRRSMGLVLQNFQPAK